MKRFAAIAAGLAAIFLAFCCGAGGFGIPAGGLLEARAARIVTGFIVGAGLAASGCALQAVLRNSLAEPYVLGVSGGGAFGAALAMVTGAATLCPFSLPALSFVFASVSLLIVWRLSDGRVQSSLILTGVVVGAVFSSLLLLILTFADAKAVHGVTWWLLGNLQSAPWSLIALAALLVTVAVFALLFETRSLDVLLLGERAAFSAGVDLRREVPFILAAATLAAASAVALSGIIGFVGLIVPHMMRKLFGAGHRLLLPGSVFFGGVFLVLCDTLARTAAPPCEIPVGVLTSLAGGPFFLCLLCKKR